MTSLRLSLTAGIKIMRTNTKEEIKTMKTIKIGTALRNYLESERYQRYARECPSLYTKEEHIKASKRYREQCSAVLTELTEAITAAEGRATTRRITAIDVLAALGKIEAALGITHKALEGVKASVDCWAQVFPSAYKYTPESTHFDAVFKNNSWKITSIYRDDCGRNKYTVEHTEASKAAIIDKLSRW